MRIQRFSLVITLALLLVAPAVAYDDEDYKPPKPEEDEEVTVDVEYWGSSTDPALHRVAEYEDVDPGVAFGVHTSSALSSDTQTRIDMYRRSSADFRIDSATDVKRVLRFDVQASGLLHRLDHDPVSNLEAVSDIKVVRSTDLEPGADYRIRHRLLNIEANFQPRYTPSVTLRGGVRQQEREGTKQVLHTGHCTSCHTVAQGREVDQTTTDGILGVHFARGNVDLDYELLGRKFREGGEMPIAPFETPYRPATPGTAPDPLVLITPFNDRLWYPTPGLDPDSGTAAFDQVPTVEKTAHTLKFRAGMRENDALSLTLVQSKTENRQTMLDYDFTGARGRYLWRIGKKARVKLWAQYDDIENESVLVDLPTLWGGGPFPTTYGGFLDPITFEAWRQAVDDPTLNFADFTRLSAMDRTDSRIGADVYWRAMRRGTLRLGYKFRKIDRDNVMLIDGTGETTSHTLKANWNQRLRKKLRWDSTLVYSTIDNPYANVAGILRAFDGYRDQPAGIVNGNAPSPKSGLSYQYYQLHDLRVADVSNVPTDQLRLRTAATWTPKGTWSLNGNLRFNDAENDDLNFSTWERTTWGVGANFWIAANPELHFTVGVDHYEEETDAFAAVPLMDG